MLQPVDFWIEVDYDCPQLLMAMKAHQYINITSNVIVIVFMYIYSGHRLVWCQDYNTTSYSYTDRRYRHVVYIY